MLLVLLRFYFEFLLRPLWDVCWEASSHYHLAQRWVIANFHSTCHLISLTFIVNSLLFMTFENSCSLSIRVVWTSTYWIKIKIFQFWPCAIINVYYIACWICLNYWFFFPEINYLRNMIRLIRHYWTICFLKLRIWFCRILAFLVQVSPGMRFWISFLLNYIGVYILYYFLLMCLTLYTWPILLRVGTYHP